MTATKLPVIRRHLSAFVFDGTPINEGLVRSLYAGSFLPNRRNIVLVGGTGTGKTHLAIAITTAVVRAGARGRYFNTVDLVNRLEEESRLGKAGALAAQLARIEKAPGVAAEGQAFPGRKGCQAPWTNPLASLSASSTPSAAPASAVVLSLPFVVILTGSPSASALLGFRMVVAACWAAEPTRVAISPARSRSAW